MRATWTIWRKLSLRSCNIETVSYGALQCPSAEHAVVRSKVYVTDVNIHGWRIGVDVCRRLVSFKSTAEQQLHSTENWCPCKK